ncbi:MAG: hypothetical protein JWQ17_6063, partial [Tardiphaga sp.]|nr:hypothetical protein [Tardiphaga sp.]
TFAAVPFLVFAAPFIIMRNTLRGRRIERRRFEFVMMATVLAGSPRAQNHAEAAKRVAYSGLIRAIFPSVPPAMTRIR